jgi:hypothetical protein
MTKAAHFRYARAGLGPTRPVHISIQPHSALDCLAPASGSISPSALAKGGQSVQ